jgi:hypothetical protein
MRSRFEYGSHSDRSLVPTPPREGNALRAAEQLFSGGQLIA